MDCGPTPQSACTARIFHSAVPGAEGYVVVTATGGRESCTTLTSRLCTVRFARGAPGCGNVLVAIDAEDDDGLPSRTFCIFYDD